MWLSFPLGISGDAFAIATLDRISVASTGVPHVSNRKSTRGPCTDSGSLWSSLSQQQPPERAAVAPGVKYVTAAWSIDRCKSGLWPKWKFMKNWWSPQIIFPPFPFSVLCQCSEERLNEVLNALVARRLWFKGRGSRDGKKTNFLPYFLLKENKAFQISRDLLPF